MLGLFKKKERQFHAFAKGEILPLDKVNDPVFAQKMMGDGFAIQLKDSTIYSPADAVISMIAETKHAIGFTDSNGVEFLIHVGLDTVNLKGQGFTTFVKVGDKVSQGDKLLEIDIEFMKKQGIDLITPCVITNYQSHPFEHLVTSKEVDINTPVLSFK